MTCGATISAWSDPTNGAVYTFTVEGFDGSLYATPEIFGDSNEGVALVVIGNMQWLGNWAFIDGEFDVSAKFPHGTVTNFVSLQAQASNASCDGGGNVTSVTSVAVGIPWVESASPITLTRVI